MDNVVQLVNISDIIPGHFKPSNEEKEKINNLAFIELNSFNPNLSDSVGNSALHIVSTIPDDRARGLIQKLVDKGININSTNIAELQLLDNRFLRRNEHLQDLPRNHFWRIHPFQFDLISQILLQR